MPRANPGNTLGYTGIIENQFKSWMKIPIILIFYVFNLKSDIFQNLQERKHVIKPPSFYRLIMNGVIGKAHMRSKMSSITFFH